VSTLSRLESGSRKPTLERGGMTMLPLTQRTRVPHWIGPADGRTVEVLSLFGKQGERAHLRARPATKS